MNRKNEKLVTVAEFANSSDADLAKLALDDAGIDSVVMGETAGVSLYHLFDHYVKLCVFKSDARQAAFILSAKENQQGDE